MITQFAAEISKLPIKATQQGYFGQTSEPNDLGYIRKFIGKEQAEQLRDLDTGEFFYSYKKHTEKIQNNRNGEKPQFGSKPNSLQLRNGISVFKPQN